MTGSHSSRKAFSAAPFRLGTCGLTVWASILCLSAFGSSPARAGIGKNLESCEMFYGPSEPAPMDMLRSGFMGNLDRIVAENPDTTVRLFRDARPFGLQVTAFFSGDAGCLFSYMRPEVKDGGAGTAPLSDAEIETLLMINSSGAPWKKTDEGVADPVKTMWTSQDGKYVAAYVDTGHLRALSVMSVAYVQAAPATPAGKP